MLESLFNKNAGLQVYNFTKKRLKHRCFPVNIAKFLRTAFFIEHLWWMLLNKISKLRHYSRQSNTFTTTKDVVKPFLLNFFEQFNNVFNKVVS